MNLLNRIIQKTIKKSNIFLKKHLTTIKSSGIIPLNQMVLPQKKEVEMNFHEFIRSKGITQTQLADAMGCVRANVSLWATGTIFPTPASIENIIKGFAELEITVTYDEVFQALLCTKREKNDKEN